MSLSGSIKIFLTKLLGSEGKELRHAITDSFPSKASLEIMIRESELGINIEEIAFGKKLNDVVYELIEWAESQNKLDILINAAYELNPENPKLKAFIEKLTLNNPNMSTSSDEAKTFTFEVVTVNRSGAIIKRETRSAQYFTENLGSNVTLDVE
jgi:Effector-associated domain 1